MTENHKPFKRTHSAIVPDELRKVDTSVNGDAHRLVREQRQLEADRHYRTVRVNSFTVICIPSDADAELRKNRWLKRNNYLKSVKDEQPVKAKSKRVISPTFINRSGIDSREIHALLDSGKTIHQAARALGCSEGLIYGRLRREQLLAEQTAAQSASPASGSSANNS